MRGLNPSTLAGVFALAAFAVAVVGGLASGNPASAVLARALLAMVVCYPVGLAIGAVAHRLVEQHIDMHRNDNPVPDASDDADGDGIEVIEEDGEEVLVV